MPHCSPTPPPAHVEWARYLKKNIPGPNVRVHVHYDEPNENSVCIFTSENDEGIVAATIGLMDYDQSRRPGVSIPTEVIVDARSHEPYVANVASTIAFCVIKDGWQVAPDLTFPDVVGMYAPDLRVKHVMFVPTFQWGDAMSKVRLSDRTIYPLLAVPITEAELRFVESGGADELTSRWERAGVDVLDWSRDSTV